MFIIEQSYSKQNDDLSWDEYTHSIQTVHKNIEDALNVLRAIYKGEIQNSNAFDVAIDEEAYNPYVIYRWLNAEGTQQERLVQIITRDLT